jgi:hypothetical protein
VVFHLHGEKNGKKHGKRYVFVRKDADHRKIPMLSMEKLKNFLNNWLTKLTNHVADRKLRFYIERTLTSELGERHVGTHRAKWFERRS